MRFSFTTLAVFVGLCATSTQAAAASTPPTCCFSGVCNMRPRVMNPVPSRTSPLTSLAAALWAMVLPALVMRIVTLCRCQQQRNGVLVILCGGPSVGRLR
ncbi:hypothetical protein B0H14DRAFT_103079 [Mycena olivaceomarginata]|nr:hypothetical protein B0H14DRAFT_103079 [Mycena olivaceomarginata]